MERIAFTVWGEPKTQGSKKSDAIYKKDPATGRPVPVTNANGRVVTVVRESNPKLHDWRHRVTMAAAAVYDGDVVTGGVGMELTFMFPRPAGHYGTGRNSRVLKASAPLQHTQMPDVSKLTRAVEDSLTGLIYADDSQVYMARHRKVWVHRWERAGVHVVVWPDRLDTVGEHERSLQGVLAVA